MKQPEKTLFPRLTNGCTVKVKGDIYKVYWLSTRNYEFISKTTHTRVKTEVEVRDMLLQKRIKVLDWGLDAAFV